MREAFRLGIRMRLALLIQAAMLALGVSTAFLASARQRATLEEELRRRGTAIAGDLATFAVRPLLSSDLATLRRLVNHARSQEHVQAISVLDPDGVVVMDTDLQRVGRAATSPAAVTALASTSSVWEEAPAIPDAEPAFAISVPITAGAARLGTVLLTYSRAATEREIAESRRQILVVGTVAAGLAGLLAYALAVYVSRPITRLAVAMRTAAKGDVPPRLAAVRTDEFGALEESFNAMAADLSAHRRHMEDLVQARTAQLLAANARLASEVGERARAEAELRVSRETLRNLATHLQSVRERERTDIAREIHDELGQSLTALKMDVHWLGNRLGDAPELADKTHAMSKTIDTTVQAVRRISAELRPKLLDDLGLSAAIEWQARQFEQRSGIRCRTESDPEDIVLDAARSTALFRIFQEALTNVARHASATAVSVRLALTGCVVNLTVADDGVGITEEQAVAPHSLGIVGMRERVTPLGGTLVVSGAAGAGTTVSVSIPAEGAAAT